MKEENMKTLPAVALRGLVVFPGMFIHFDVGREKSMNAFKRAIETDGKIFLVTQKDITEDDPDYDGLYKIGAVASVKQTLKFPGKSGDARAAVEGLCRARLIRGIPGEKFLETTVFPIREPNIKRADADYVKALVRKAKEAFAEYAERVPRMPVDLIAGVARKSDPGALADFIAGNVMLEYEDRQRILSALNPIRRLEEVCVLLANEGNLLALEADINEKVRERIDENQREYFLKEQLKTISAELGGGLEESGKFEKAIKKLNAPDEVKDKLKSECARLEKYPPQSPEAAVVENYLETCLSLPWNRFSPENSDVDRAKKILDRDHYGLAKVKERILEYISVRALAPDIKGQIICLAGPPGVGKTSVARSMARATGRKYQRLALGGVKDEAEIRGHRKTYVGAMPGGIINAVKRAGTSNPLILLDEVDKLSSDYKGDPTSALLEALDPEQNSTFRDHYIEVPFDLSGVMFVTTANLEADIPNPLKDRMEIIELGSYTAEEKFHIAKKHLVPKQLKRHGLNARALKIKDEALRIVIDGYTREAGVRELERLIAALCRKAAARIARKETERVCVKPDELESFLGARKYKENPFDGDNEIGATNGLAWTSAGGEILEIEATVLKGTGKLELTGSLGNVMKESAKTAVSYIRSKAEGLSIDPNFYKDSDIHIHVPDGATPKDGPSAGATIATSLVSALSGRKVRKDVAMTGEITLRGKVLPIGGLKEKAMAAYRAGIKTVIIPYGNSADINEMDPEVKRAVEFAPVKTVEAVWDIALEKEKEIGLAEPRINPVESRASSAPPLAQ